MDRETKLLVISILMVMAAILLHYEYHSYEQEKYERHLDEVEGAQR